MLNVISRTRRLLHSIAERLTLEGILALQDPTEGYASLLRRYGTTRCLQGVRGVHQHIVSNGFASNKFLANILIQSYGKCGSLEAARAAFDSIRRRNSISYASMILAYVQAGSKCCHEEALRLYHRMRTEGVQVDAHVFTIVLRACATSGNVEAGKIVHEHIVASRIQDQRVGNALVNMYAKCNKLEDAKRVFDAMPTRDIHAWTTLITAYAQRGHCREALDLYQKMNEEGVKPDNFLFASIVGACSSIEEGQAIHACIGVHQYDEVVETALITMYTKCGSLKDARKVFDGMKKKIIPGPWAAMILAYEQEGYFEDALKLFWKMEDVRVKADAVTYSVILRVCASMANLDEGRAVHDRVKRSGIHLDVVLGTALVNMYCKCGDLENANVVFHGMQNKSVITWSVMILGYSQHDRGLEAIQLYKKMLTARVQPNSSTVVSVLAACGSPDLLDDGKEIHKSLLGSELEADVIVQSALVNMYAKCGSLKDAEMVFNAMPSKHLVVWTTLMVSFMHDSQPQKALDLYLRMLDAGVEPDGKAYASVLTACGMLEALQQGRKIHSRIRESKQPMDQALQNSLLSMYCRCASINEARDVFENMEEPQETAWNLMINTCGNLGDVEQAKGIHDALRSNNHEREAAPAIINMYAKCSGVEYAKIVFESMKEKSVACWTSLMGVCVQQGRPRGALDLYTRMEAEKMDPDSVTYATVLGACSSLGALEEIHRKLLDSGFAMDVLVQTALVNMYGKCGALDEANNVFLGMQGTNLVSWSALLSAFAQNGHGKKAVGLCKLMELEGVSPGVTLISVLASCSHDGMLNEAWEYFRHMEQDRGIMPVFDHYVCMIDVLARSGRLQDAEDLIESMPFEADALTWSTLLAACTSYKDIQRGTRAAKLVQKLDPGNKSSRILLANIS